MTSLLPAPLPLRARVLGAVAVLVLLSSTAAAARDLALADPPWVAMSIALTVALALGWSFVDAPLRYELGDGTLAVLTRARRVIVPVVSTAHVGSIGRDRFAINGGFGWYGWFRIGDRTVRAFVTDPACAVIVETGRMPIVISPRGGRLDSTLA